MESPLGPHSGTSFIKEPTPDLHLTNLPLKNGPTPSVVLPGHVSDSLGAVLQLMKSIGLKDISVPLNARLRVDSSGNWEVLLLTDWGSHPFKIARSP